MSFAEEEVPETKLLGLVLRPVERDDERGERRGDEDGEHAVCAGVSWGKMKNAVDTHSPIASWSA